MTSAITVMNSIRLSIRSVKALPPFTFCLINFQISYAHEVTCEATPRRILCCSYHMLIAIRVDPLFVITKRNQNCFVI